MNGCLGSPSGSPSRRYFPHPSCCAVLFWEFWVTILSLSILLSRFKLREAGKASCWVCLFTINSFVLFKVFVCWPFLIRQRQCDGRRKAKVLDTPPHPHNTEQHVSFTKVTRSMAKKVTIMNFFLNLNLLYLQYYCCMSLSLLVVVLVS